MTPTEVDCRVGEVETQTIRLDLPQEGFALDSGERLTELNVAYEAYGELSDGRDNVIFICHSLSGDAHVAGCHKDVPNSEGWWDEMVGPGKGIDVQHYYVICANILGGCKGTTGPSSTNPATGKPYGSAFPHITLGDIINVHRLLLKQLGIERLAAVAGGSLGGMQAIEWTLRYPGTIDRCICIASAPSLSAQALSFDIVGRKAITSDPDWRGGDYYESCEGPREGLALARKIGHITYLSQEMMMMKFGRSRREHDAADVEPGGRFRSDFEVERYLEYQGEKFVKRFDANSYLCISRAMDEFDLAEGYDSLEEAFKRIESKLLIVALSADWLFPPEQSRSIANALLRAGKRVSYCLLNAPHGHDAFLVDVAHLAEVIRAFLPWVGPRRQRQDDGRVTVAGDLEKAAAARKREYEAILKMISPGSRVLDLGCGDGELLSLLAEQRQVAGIGIDIDIANVTDVIDRGHDIFQDDIDTGLAMLPDDTYDYAVLSETLQVVRKPRFVLRELLRVAREGIVSFPNFGKWSHRMYLWLAGRMPKGGALPFEWYTTPNIHLFTLRDFVDLCAQDGIDILDTVCMPGGRADRLLLGCGMCNAGADRILVRLTRTDRRRQGRNACPPFRQ